MSDTKEPTADQKTVQAPKRKKFVVARTTIFLDDGAGSAFKAEPGDVVELTAKEAAHFSKIDCLKPYLEKDEE